MLLAELLYYRPPRAVPARRLGLAVYRRYHDPRVVGGGAVLREVDVEIGRVGKRAGLHAEEPRGERSCRDAERVRRESLGRRRQRARLLRATARPLGPRHDRRRLLRLRDGALQPHAGLRQRVAENVLEEVRIGLVEPALGHDVEVELLAERIGLTPRARRELGVEARERLPHEPGLLLLEALEQDRVALGQTSVVELVALRQRHREQVREPLERVARRLGGRHAALGEGLPAAARADPPLRGLLGPTFEQLLPPPPLLRRPDLPPLPAQSDPVHQRGAPRGGTATPGDRPGPPGRPPPPRRV